MQIGGTRHIFYLFGRSNPVVAYSKLRKCDFNLVCEDLSKAAMPSRGLPFHGSMYRIDILLHTDDGGYALYYHPEQIIQRYNQWSQLVGNYRYQRLE